MSLAKTLRDIATESRSNKSEKDSLRLIAIDVAKLEKFKMTQDKSSKKKKIKSRPYPIE